MIHNFCRIFLYLFTFFIACNASIDNVYGPQLITDGRYHFTSKFEPTWESLDARKLPGWYEDAKVGIFIHFGVYSAISYGSEWFWTNWKNSKIPSYIDFVNRTQAPSWTYQDYARDFTCELFNATEWAEMFSNSGAQYVVLTSKHHEGFTLYPSTYSFSWNSIDVGPNRDIIKELSAAVRQKKMKFGIYYSLFEWFNRMYEKDKLHAFFQSHYVDNKMWPELMEIIDRYSPEVIWSDGDWEAPDSYWRAKEFLAWLYNESPVKDTVVTNDRWGIGTNCRHGDFFTCSDRFNPGVLQKHKFENAMTIDKMSWGHRGDAILDDFMTSSELIRELVTTVACNGNLLVNVGPNKYGKIEAIFADRLRDLGRWLKINGKAIYGSRPWTFQNETTDIWYTLKQGATRSKVYVHVLKYPYDTNCITLKLLGKYLDEDSLITLLGYQEPIEFSIDHDDSSVEIMFPDKRFVDKEGLFSAWVFEVDISQ